MENNIYHFFTAKETPATSPINDLSKKNGKIESFPGKQTSPETNLTKSAETANCPADHRGTSDHFRSKSSASRQAGNFSRKRRSSSISSRAVKSLCPSPASARVSPLQPITAESPE